MRPYLLFALSTLLAMQGEARDMNATDTQRFIDELIANPPPSEQVEQAAALAQELRQHQQPEHRQWAEQLAGQRAQQAKPMPQALYFVSFSIPEEGLKRLVLDADAFGIPRHLARHGEG